MSADVSPPLRALVADDERLLREQLKTRLAQVWPELQVVGEARDGQEAIDKAEELRPDVVFLDIRMPAMTGIEAAREIVTLQGWQGEIVFVTAYDEYAVAAFEHGALDYLLKPVEAERLAQTAARVKARMQARRAEAPALDAPQQEAALDSLLEKFLSAQRAMGRAGGAEPPMRWIQATSGTTTRLIDVKDVLFFRSDEKYTRVQTKDQEAFIRTPIRELMPRLDPEQFWQIHRSTIVNLGCIAAVTRDDTGRQRVQINGHPEVLEVSRSFAHLFRAS
ncbi:LytR/AlgR family response regulator transcription factor [Caenimonas aquaedulcis]|uniref:Response regulator transcription factor n=1 Tax=Caenimonas aquaedulcis TaxID=2793270 RepID=A0A931MFE2_9BURK|nr:LytTR family DNA-binding domain-containing protein [Caenimonas aquaedulcis]MBG9386974.1 response regulator transcription factor [Caenimonas aquaedulcis]